jgi:general secretion pathway protein A
MYQAHWGLTSKPFESSHESDFYYPSETHQGAVLKLRYVVENRQAGALLSGAGGLGKSLLVQSLFRCLPEEIAPRVHLVFPQLPADQLLACIADELTGREITAHTPSQRQSARHIQQALHANAEAGRHAVLAIDEAHLLADSEALDTLRLLLNFGSDGRPGLTLLLVGQGPLLPAIHRATSLEERLAVKCVLRPFTLEETVSYVSHRLAAAGGCESIFESAALDAVHELTGGVPRRINRLCELSLLIGYAEERRTIAAEQVEAVSDEMITVAPD